MSILLGIASTKVLLNGRPGSRICHTKGLRQGGPLFLMLFVLVMEVFGSLIRVAEAQSFFIPLRCTTVHLQVSLYEDNIIMFIMLAENDLLAIKTIMWIFRDASKLYTDMDNCITTPIVCS